MSFTINHSTDFGINFQVLRVYAQQNFVVK